MESDKRSAMLIWASVGAAAAGIVAVAVLSRWRNAQQEGDLNTRLRDVQDVLSDINRKMQEIEDHIPELPPARRVSESYLSSARTATNGTPAQ